MPVALIGATCSGPEEEAISAASFALGARRSGRIRFFNCGTPVQLAAASDVGEGDDVSRFFEAGMAAAKAQVPKTQ